MRMDMAGEISVAIPIIFTLLLAFLFIFLFTTRNFSLKQTFTPAAMILFAIYTAVVAGLWGFFLNQKKQRDGRFPGKTQIEQAAGTAQTVSGMDFSDEIIIHNDEYPHLKHYSHTPEEATPVPDFNYRQKIVPRTINERIRFFQQIRNLEQQRRTALQNEMKRTDLEFSKRESIRKELLFLQTKYDRFLSPVLRNLTVSRNLSNRRKAAKNRKYNEELTAGLKKRIEEFLANNKTRRYSSQEHETVDGFIKEIQSGLIDPNMTITDAALPIYSGPLLRAAIEQRFPRTGSLIMALIRQNADINFEITHPANPDLLFYLQYTLPYGLENVDTFRDRNILLSILESPLIHPQRAELPLLLGANALAADENGRTALHYTAMRGDTLPLLPTLIYSGAEINAMDRDGFTPLMLAYFSWNRNMVEELEKFAPDRKIVNRFGAAAKDYAVQRKLIQAAINNHPAEIQAALDGGADPYMVLGMKMNILQLACFNDSREAVEVLLKNGVNPNVLPEYESPQTGRLPLHIALKKNDLHLFESLLKKNANYKTQVLCIHQKPYPLIHFACEISTGKPFLKLLLNAGADINSRSEEQETPLMKAVFINKNEEVVRFLLENGADVNAQDIHGETALMKAAASGQESLIRLLLKGGADPHLKSKSGRTANDYTGVKAIRALLGNPPP